MRHLKSMNIALFIIVALALSLFLTWWLTLAPVKAYKITLNKAGMHPIVLQGVYHTAREAFYRDVADEILLAKEKGFGFVLEGAGWHHPPCHKPRSPEIKAINQFFSLQPYYQAYTCDSESVYGDISQQEEHHQAEKLYQDLNLSSKTATSFLLALDESKKLPIHYNPAHMSFKTAKSVERSILFRRIFNLPMDTHQSNVHPQDLIDAHTGQNNIELSRLTYAGIKGLNSIREKHAMESMIAMAKKKPVFVIYGQAHLANFVRNLKRIGWAQVDSKSMTAITR